LFFNYLVSQNKAIIRRATSVALLFFLNLKLHSQSFDIRALWIVRDHMVTSESIDKVLQFAENNNYNHLFVQIRGRGDAYYTSKIVPRSHLLQKSDFDPLAYILKITKNKKNLKIHAWMNVYYLWSSKQKPSQNDHILLNHSDWLDNNNPDQMDVPHMLERMKQYRNINGEGFYLAPTHPEVDAHLQNVITELLQNYSFDGIHFDYIRYHAQGWGMNPTGLKMFLNYSNGGMPGIPSLKVQDKPSFSDFKRSAITSFLKKSSMRIRAYQPKCIISAAVKPNLTNARNIFCQEWDVWLKNGYIDWAVPMNYTGDNNIFQKNIINMKENISLKYLDKIIMGIGVYNQNPKSAEQKISKIAKEQFRGFSIFSYTVFKENPSYVKKLKKYFK